MILCGSTKGYFLLNFCKAKATGQLVFKRAAQATATKKGERKSERERDTALIFSPYHFYLDFVREVKICMQCLLIVKEIVSHDDITKSWNQILSIAEFC